MRPAIQFIQHTFGDNLVGAEIGVDKGKNSKDIYEALKPKMLFLIDPWNNYMDFDSKEIIGEAQYQETLLTLKGLTNIKILRTTSFEASKNIENESLDFVYIDGDHTYEMVLGDILNWYPKVKKGGVVGGHDFHLTVPGVIRAVNEFCSTMKIQMYNFQEDWWVIK